jgi:sRNA-binding carbon storage regulator CsrA
MEGESIIQIDHVRSIAVTPTRGNTVVLAVEDPHSVAVVEITVSEVDALIEALQRCSNDPR